MFKLWVISVLVVWCGHALLAGLKPHIFYAKYYDKRKHYDKPPIDEENVYWFIGIAFFAGIFAFILIPLGLALSVVCLPVYGCYKLGQKIYSKKNAK